MIPYLLLLVGYIALFVEFFVPGGLMGMIAAVLIVASIALFAYEASSGLFTILFILAAVAGVIVVVKLALWQIRTKGQRQGFYAAQDQQGFQATQWDRSLIGQQGTAYCDLKPGGYVLIEGQKHAAISQSGYLLKGEKVIVLGGEGETLLVKKG